VKRESYERSERKRERARRAMGRAEREDEERIGGRL
jgi:hypothetical protein